MTSKAAAPLHRHMQFAISAVVGGVATVLALLLKASLAYSIGANAFFVVYIAIVLWQMPLLTGDYLSRNARATDQPVWIIFLVTLIVIGVAVVSLFQLINSKESPELAVLLFSLTSLPLGWFTLQAMIALHYAHLYWMDDEGPKSGRKVPVGGLEFPGKDRPDGWDFLYFAATIGMTFQTSDTEITTTELRCTVLAHAVLSFFFNTVIVAAAVNVAVSLGG